MTKAKELVGAILAIIISSFSILGVVTFVIQSATESGTKTRGGAKRLRTMCDQPVGCGRDDCGILLVLA